MEIENYWIARDLDGTLWMIEGIPTRDEIKNVWVMPSVELAPNYILLPSELFPEITWEDEPVQAKIGIRNK